MTRRFEFVSGNSAKFWQVTQEDTQVTVGFGRLGTSGQSQIKTFPSETAARLHADSLVRQKLAKGYIAVAA